jgi:hypothetical protein
VLSTGEEIVHEGTHFLLAKDCSCFDGLLFSHGPDQLLAPGEADLAGEMFVLLEQVFERGPFISLPGIGGCALDDKAVLSKGLDGIAERL